MIEEDFSAVPVVSALCAPRPFLELVKSNSGSDGISSGHSSSTVISYLFVART